MDSSEREVENIIVAEYHVSFDLSDEGGNPEYKTLLLYGHQWCSLSG